MANAKRRRNQATTDDDFDILLSDALGLMLAPGHIATGDSWHFRVDGNGADARLIITRSRASVTIPDPES
jgi:hypothetical protein